MKSMKLSKDYELARIKNYLLNAKRYPLKDYSQIK